MHLISLVIQGFKSFPERTVLEFHEGVTTIVGPNGSGKSNVTDAIRWVLGEQSVKTLRGDSMQDIIFSGTSTRRSMSFAEVTMNIDNRDRLLNLDYAEVAITRRLYRSGESEYLINRQAVRLKDINNLFMDTGLGKDSYSIIGQGKVDEILSTKSEDRRRVFEEAAGIQKYKSRKVDAARRLEQTEANLTRVNDILAELESQIGPLGKQAETAKTYLNLHGRMRELDIDLIAKQIRDAVSDQDELQRNLALTEADLAASEEKQEALDIRQLADREALARLNESLAELREGRNRLTEKESEVRQEEVLLTERKEQLERRLAEQGESSELIAAELLSLENEIQERSAQMAKQEEQLAAATALFEGLRESLHKHRAEVNTAEAQLDDLNRKERAFLSEKQRLEHAKQRQDSEAGLLQQQETELEDESRQIQSQIIELDERIRDCEQKLSRVAAEDDEHMTQSSLLQSKIIELRSALSDLETEGQRIAQTIRNQTYRLDTLRDLERNMEGYAEPVRNVLRKAEGDSRYRHMVRGALGSLLRVDTAYELAIEIALGGAVQNIVVEDSKTASGLIELLKRDRLGRATFLPMDTIQARSLQDRELNRLDQLTKQGFIGIASELLSYPQEIDAIVKNLLGRIVIVDTLDNAISIAKEFRQSFRIVTLEGDVVNPGGSMTGGYQKKKSAGLLGRQRDISRIEVELKQLYKDHAAAEQAVKEAGLQLKTTVREQERLQAKGMELAQLKTREEARLQALNEQSEGFSLRYAQKLKQASDRREQARKRKADSNEIDERIRGLDTDISMTAEAIRTAEQSVQALGRLQSEVRDRLAEQDLSRARLEEALKSAREVYLRIKRQFDGRKYEASQAVSQRDQAEAEIKTLERRLEEVASAVISAKEAIRTRDMQVLNLDAGRQDQEERVNRLYADIRQQAETTLMLKTRFDQAVEKQERLKAELDQSRNRLWEDYELTAVSLEKDGRNIAEDFDVKTATKEIQKLRAAIRSLGSVNVDAVEQYEQISERFQFLCTQRDDIETARNELNQVITELVSAMQEQFKTNFDLIRHYFRETFEELFGGGEADIQLEDNDQILESNIEIKASPPGKKLQNMLLLSGGERSLTAIALLFAILKLRPTPFCVLDEIEAALDDVNTLRFTEYIRSYKEKSQFIMVTHRKGTMESADMIYGVTMQEKGVSKVLSMVLSDAT